MMAMYISGGSPNSWNAAFITSIDRDSEREQGNTHAGVSARGLRPFKAPLEQLVKSKTSMSVHCCVNERSLYVWNSAPPDRGYL